MIRENGWIGNLGRVTFPQPGHYRQGYQSRRTLPLVQPGGHTGDRVALGAGL